MVDKQNSLKSSQPKTQGFRQFSNDLFHDPPIFGDISKCKSPHAGVQLASKNVSFFLEEASTNVCYPQSTADAQECSRAMSADPGRYREVSRPQVPGGPGALTVPAGLLLCP